MLISQTYPFRGSSRLVEQAARRGDIALISELIQLGVAIDEPNPDDNGVTPLWWAAKEGHAEIVAALHGAGANINVRVHKQTPLFTASQIGHANVVAVILMRDRSAQNISFILNAYDLHAAMSWGIATDLLDELIQFKIESGSNPRAIPVFPVEIAGMKGHDDVVAVFEAFPTSEVQCSNDDRALDSDKERDVEATLKGKDVRSSEKSEVADLDIASGLDNTHSFGHKK